MDINADPKKEKKINLYSMSASFLFFFFLFIFCDSFASYSSLPKIDCYHAKYLKGLQVED
jgi:hypothetical protein